ncbi:hypothetical protein [Enterococcus phage PEF9]
MKLIDAEVVLNQIDKAEEEFGNTFASGTDFEKGWDEGYLDGFRDIKGLVKDIIIEDEIPLATPSDMIPKSEFFRLLEAIQKHTGDWEEHQFIAGIMEAYK